MSADPERPASGEGPAVPTIAHLVLFPVAALVFGMLSEYFGWRIIEKMVGESRFPGFLDLETWKSIAKNTGGALIVGLLFCLFALPFRGFRAKWKHLLPLFLWAGLLVFYAYMAVLIWIGLRSV
jgi:hypothetical protein